MSDVPDPEVVKKDYSVRICEKDFAMTAGIRVLAEIRWTKPRTTRYNVDFRLRQRGVPPAIAAHMVNEFVSLGILESLTAGAVKWVREEHDQEVVATFDHCILKQRTAALLQLMADNGGRIATAALYEELEGHAGWDPTSILATMQHLKGDKVIMEDPDFVLHFDEGYKS